MTESLPKVKGLPLLIFAVTAAVAYWAIIYWVSVKHALGGIVSVGFLIFAPIATPALAVLLLDPRGRLPNGEHLKIGFIVVAALIVGSLVVLREGGICVVMLSPLYLFGAPFGAVLVGHLLRWRSTRLLSSIVVLLPLLAAPIEKPVMHPARTEIVTTVADIVAPPETVWRNTIAVSHIKPSELDWTFTQSVVGVPMPLDARLEGDGVGAVRHVVWGGGIHFDEVITGWQLYKSLTWSFRFSKDSIPVEIERSMSPDSDYLKVESGGYQLERLPNGHTRLTLHTRYWEHTALNGYCAWWGRIFIGDFHRNVIRVIRSRSERAVQA